MINLIRSLFALPFYVVSLVLLVVQVFIAMIGDFINGRTNKPFYGGALLSVLNYIDSFLGGRGY